MTASEEETTKTTQKRTADRQITKDDYNEAEEGHDDETMGTGFARAPDDVLRKRRIVKAKRNQDGTVVEKKKKETVNGDGADKEAKDDDTEKETKNPLAGVSLIQPASTATNNKVFGSFSGFSGFGTAAAKSSGSSGFGFGSSSSGGFGSTGTASGFGTAPSSGFGSLNTTTGTGFGKTTSDDTNVWKPKETTTTDSSKPEATNNDKTSSQANDDSTAPEASRPRSSSFSSAPPPPPAHVLPDQYQLQSGEEEEAVLLEYRCKSYRLGRKRSAASSTSSMAEGAPSVPHSDQLLAPKAASEASAAESSDDKKEVTNAAGEKKEDGAESSTSAPAEVKKQYHDVGTGPLRVLQHSTTQAVRLVQRRESSKQGPATKVILNLPLYRESCIDEQPSEQHVQMTTLDPATKTPQQVLFKFKLPVQAAHVQRVLQEQVASAKSFCGATPPPSPNTSAGEENGGKDDKGTESKPQSAVVETDEKESNGGDKE